MVTPSWSAQALSPIPLPGPKQPTSSLPAVWSSDRTRPVWLGPGQSLKVSDCTSLRGADPQWPP